MKEIQTIPDNDLNALEYLRKMRRRVACGAYSTGGMAVLRALQGKYGPSLFFVQAHSLSIHDRLTRANMAVAEIERFGACLKKVR